MTVPGCVDGWGKLHKRFGRLPWSDLFRPAIYYAENGFPVTEIIQDHWRTSLRQVGCRRECPESVFAGTAACPARRAVPQSPTGKALKLIAAEGPAAFYTRPDREAISEDLGAPRRQDGMPLISANSNPNG